MPTLNKEQLREEWKDFIRRQNLLFISKDNIFNFFWSAFEEHNKEVKKRLREYPQKMLHLHKGKLPFVVFEGQATEEEKVSIYFQAFRDAVSLLS